MSEGLNDSTLSVTLSVAQLRQLVAEAVEKALGPNHRNQELLTAEELAEKMKVPVSWVYEQSRHGKIPTHRIGRYIRFSLAEVIESQRAKNQPTIQG